MSSETWNVERASRPGLAAGDARARAGLARGPGAATPAAAGLAGEAAHRPVHLRLAAVDAPGAAAERRVAPVPAALHDVVERARVGAERIGADRHRPDEALGH